VRVTGAPWTEASARAIGVDWLRAELAPASDFGRRARERERAFTRGDEPAARAAIERVARVARELTPETVEGLRRAMRATGDPSGAVARACGDGILSDVETFEIARFLGAVNEMRTLALRAGACALALPDVDPALDAAFEPGRAHVKSGRAAPHSFYLDDRFDAALAQARAAAVRSQAAFDGARSRLAARVAAFARLEHVRDGEFVLMRDAFDGPLPPEVRVVREAATYLLCELALDGDALAALAARDAAAAYVAQEEERVRARLGAAVRAAAPSLEAAVEALGALDSLLGRVHFAQRHAACVPQIDAACALAFEDARYLPLEAALAERGREYRAISLELDGVGVLTGPNMGGKTAALRTCGFLAACVALGVPVPARRARIGLFDEIAWIGLETTGEGAGGLLSAFGSEIIALRSFFERGPRRALVLIDEFARTTTPHEGRALSIALLDALRERGACVLAATHLSQIAADAGVAHFAIVGLRTLPAREAGTPDLSHALERIAAAMDYRVERVAEEATARADAIALADALGLDAAVVARARAILGG
jgi:hypothetical protein